MLFAFGSNGKGQLGIGNTDDQSNPQRCIFYRDSDSVGTPVRITFGGNHTLVLFESGRLFSAGSNDVGQAGPKARFASPSLPAELDTVFTEIILPSKSQKVKRCSATWEASVIVTEDDEVYTFGSGPNGELGTGVEQSNIPRKLPGFPPPNTSIVDIASGVRHTVTALSNGEVYGWGNGRKGQLGHGNKDIVPTPLKISGLTIKAKQATCGREFTYVVGDPAGSDHQLLGLEKWGLKSDAPQVPWSQTLTRKQLGSNWCGISMLDSLGKVISWGRNDRGQLAPKGLPPIKQLALGSEHALALTEYGQVLAWGWGEHGNCGSSIDEGGNVKNGWQELPLQTLLSDGEVLGLGAGCATSFIWTSSDIPSN